MTSLREDPELGQVWPVVILFADQPPHELGVVRAGLGPERVVAELAAILRDAAEVIVVGGDEAIRIAQARAVEAMAPLGGDVVAVDFYAADCGPGCSCRGIDRAQLQAVGGARLVEVAEAEVVVASAGRLRGHCAHDIPLYSPCVMCDRV